MKNKILPISLQGNYKDTLGEFSNISCGVFGAGRVNNIILTLFVSCWYICTSSERIAMSYCIYSFYYYVSIPCRLRLKKMFSLVYRDSNPPVLAGNLPFLGIVSTLLFSFQNLPFFVLFEKESDLLYLFSEIE